jgi:hypothetical protein
MKRRSIVLVLALAAGSVAATSGPAAAGVNLRNLRAGAQSSYNWAGYAQTGTFHSIAAVWTVPTLKTTYNGYSSTWVGIDGFNDGYLIQTGTEADVVNHVARYDAWWEVITPSNPAPEVVYASYSVQPGDKITGSVVKGGGGKWTMKLVDARTGKTATHTASFNGPGQSAEWIQEDTEVNGVISPAPDWQSVHFAQATANGANPKLKYSQSLDITDTHGTKEANAAAPSGGNAFTVKWLAPGTGTNPGAVAGVAWPRVRQ